jgi:hypothetical protein
MLDAWKWGKFVLAKGRSAAHIAPARRVHELDAKTQPHWVHVLTVCAIRTSYIVCVCVCVCDDDVRDACTW